MNFELPTWLNKEFLTAALQEGEPKGPRITVTKFSGERAVPPGNNFTSTIIRVKVEYTSGSEEKLTSLVIKSPIMFKSVIGELDLFSKEPNVYNELIPILKELTGCQFGPKSFYSSVKNTLVMEDLKEKGYVLCDRHKQLDFYHCKLVLKTLAKFHAGSVVCKRNYPDLIDKVGQEILYNENSKLHQDLVPMLLGGLKVVGAMCGQMGMGKDAEDLFNNCAETAAATMLRLCKPRTTGLNVLNHGDLWNSNILFKHDKNGKVVDLRFVDFQASKYTSPVMDLIYFIWTSANEDVRESHLPGLCDIYRETLNSKLEELGCKERLTAEALQEDFKDAKDYVLVTICSVLPVQMCEPEAHEAMTSEDFSLGEKKENGQDQMDMIMKLYHGKHYKSIFPKLLKHIQAWMEYYK